MGEDLSLVNSRNPGFPLCLSSQGHAEIEVKYAEPEENGIMHSSPFLAPFL